MHSRRIHVHAKDDSWTEVWGTRNGKQALGTGGLVQGALAQVCCLYMLYVVWYVAFHGTCTCTCTVVLRRKARQMTVSNFKLKFVSAARLWCVWNTLKLWSCTTTMYHKQCLFLHVFACPQQESPTVLWLPWSVFANCNQSKKTLPLTWIVFTE